MLNIQVINNYADTYPQYLFVECVRASFPLI